MILQMHHMCHDQFTCEKAGGYGRQWSSHVGHLENQKLIYDRHNHPGTGKSMEKNWQVIELSSHDYQHCPIPMISITLTYCNDYLIAIVYVCMYVYIYINVYVRIYIYI